MDLTDISSINSFITKLNPDFLIHSAAQRFPDKMQENPEQARLLNVEATKVLAESMSKSSNDFLIGNPPSVQTSFGQGFRFSIKSQKLSKGEKIALNLTFYFIFTTLNFTQKFQA